MKKIQDKGYWVSKLFYYRSWWTWLINSVRHRSITYFSAVNPGLEFGGMLDDRKSDVYKMLPEYYLPSMVKANATDQNIKNQIKEKGIGYPLIIKPDVGYRGYMVRLVENEEELDEVLKEVGDREILVQEYLTEPREFALLFYFMPKTKKFGISSFVEKILPFVIGDGKSTLEKLIEKNGSAFLDKDYVLKKNQEDLQRVIPLGKKVTIDHIGNISRGSKFYSKNEEIDAEMIESTRLFFNHLSGINFGRIDLKANSIEDVRKGDFKVLEINGAKAEPLHIYEPSFSWYKIWSSISEHWSILNQIVSEQLSGNYELPSGKKGIDAAYSFKRQTSQ